MEVVCFALGMIIGGALTGVAAFIICKGYKAKAEVLESEEKRAEKEFEIYREREMRQLESDFDRAVKMLTQNSDDK